MYRELRFVEALIDSNYVIENPMLMYGLSMQFASYLHRYLQRYLHRYLQRYRMFRWHLWTPF